jgi:methionyl-tRNA formyltransferase
LLRGPDEVVTVVTQPDREKGRGRKIIPSAVKEVALQHGLILLQPTRVKEEGFQERIRSVQPDLLVVAAYGQILPKALLSIPTHGAVNVHASLLPRYRGAAPIPWAILQGERVTGVTTMMMDEGMDTGDILLQAETPVEERETFQTLHDRLSFLGAKLLLETLEGLKSGKVHPIPQDHTQASYAPPLRKEDARIDWSKEARAIDRQVRAFNPRPGAFTEWKGQALKIYRGEVKEGPPRERTGVISWVGSDFFEVETGKDFFRITEIQLEGKRRMTVREFLSGHSVPAGTVFA